MSDLMARGIVGSLNPTSPETNLTAAERELDMQITRINELVGDLNGRLERILRQPGPDSLAPHGAMEMDSDVSRMVMDSANRVRNIANRVEDILRRVDL